MICGNSPYLIGELVISKPETLNIGYFLPEDLELHLVCLHLNRQDDFPHPTLIHLLYLYTIETTFLHQSLFDVGFDLEFRWDWEEIFDLWR